MVFGGIGYVIGAALDAATGTTNKAGRGAQIGSFPTIVVATITLLPSLLVYHLGWAGISVGLSHEKSRAFDNKLDSFDKTWKKVFWHINDKIESWLKMNPKEVNTGADSNPEYQGIGLDATQVPLLDYPSQRLGTNALGAKETAERGNLVPTKSGFESDSNDEDNLPNLSSTRSASSSSASMSGTPAAGSPEVALRASASSPLEPEIRLHSPMHALNAEDKPIPFAPSHLSKEYLTLQEEAVKYLNKNITRAKWKVLANGGIIGKTPREYQADVSNLMHTHARYAWDNLTGPSQKASNDTVFSIIDFRKIMELGNRQRQLMQQEPIVCRGVLNPEYEKDQQAAVAYLNKLEYPDQRQLKWKAELNGDLHFVVTQQTKTKEDFRDTVAKMENYLRNQTQLPLEPQSLEIWAREDGELSQGWIYDPADIRGLAKLAEQEKEET